MKKYGHLACREKDCRDGFSMNKGTKMLIIRGLKLLHFAACLALFALAWHLYRQHYRIRFASRYDLFVLGMYAFGLLCFLRTYSAYMIDYAMPLDLCFSLSLSCFFTTAIVYGVTLVAWNKFHPPWFFIGLWLVQSLVGYLWALVACAAYDRLHKPLRAAVIFRNEDDLQRMVDMDRFSKRFILEKYIENPQDLQDVVERIRDSEAVFLAGVNASLRNGIAKYCVEHDIPGLFLPHVGDIIMAGSYHIRSFHAPIMSVRRAYPMPEYAFVKRCFDIVFSALALLLLSPLMLIVALVIRCYDGGPAIYRQVRLTREGKQFRIFKFRSMRVDAESDGVARLASDRDSRITPVGRWIRATRIDELPQLLNILQGDMSVVGPRPERPEIAAEYEKTLPAFRLRLQVKAGLTGYAQIYGKYNTDPYDKLEMDLLYINRMSIMTDLQLIFATVRILFTRESTEGFDENEPTAFSDAVKTEEEETAVETRS